MGEYCPLQSVLVAGLVLFAGCGGFVGGGGSLSFTADPVTVQESAVSASGFSVASDESFTFERTFEVAGQSRTVTLNADMVHLQRDQGTGVPAQVVVLSVPTIEVVGQQINVAQQVGPASLVERARGSVGSLQQQQKVGERQVAMLGEQRTVEVFEGTRTEGGGESPVLVFVATFTHEGDTIVAVGMMSRTDGADTDAVLTAFEGVTRE